MDTTTPNTSIENLLTDITEYGNMHQEICHDISLLYQTYCLLSKNKTQSSNDKQTCNKIKDELANICSTKITT